MQMYIVLGPPVLVNWIGSLDGLAMVVSYFGGTWWLDNLMAWQSDLLILVLVLTF